MKLTKSKKPNPEESHRQPTRAQVQRPTEKPMKATFQEKNSTKKRLLQTSSPSPLLPSLPESSTFEDRRPVAEIAHEMDLAPILVTNLASYGVHSFFPIQTLALPAILNPRWDQARVCHRDFCISAPTGSGKTLVYVLPIIQSLLQRTECRLRALIVLPSRDLAVQVKEVVDHFCRNTPLKCGLAIGQLNFSREQLELVGQSSSYLEHLLLSSQKQKMDVESGDALDVLPYQHSLVDILVATPGRLVDHLEQTHGFTVEHLEYLVIDEADRLLNQSYQGWIEKVYNQIYWVESRDDSISLSTADQGYHIDKKSGILRMQPRTLRHRSNPLRCDASPPLKRLLLSATLTKNPRKLAHLGLVNPVMLVATRRTSSTPKSMTAKTLGENNEEEREQELEKSSNEGEVLGGTELPPVLGSTVVDVLRMNEILKKNEKLYSTPENLKEFMIECDTKDKPLVLLQLLHDFRDKQTIVFTSSVNATHRLWRLVQLFGIPSGLVKEYSSSLTQKQRSHLLTDCRSGKVRVLISSDAMARGMDLDTIETVINYDVPGFVKTYVHRVGRTARAGREGQCITLIKRGQVKAFWKLLRKVENNFVEPYHISSEKKQELVPRYSECLLKLKKVLQEEQCGRLFSSTDVDCEYSCIRSEDEEKDADGMNSLDMAMDSDRDSDIDKVSESSEEEEVCLSFSTSRSSRHNDNHTNISRNPNNRGNRKRSSRSRSAMTQNHKSLRELFLTQTERSVRRCLSSHKGGRERGKKRVERVHPSI